MVQNIVLHLVGQLCVARHMLEEAAEKLEAARSGPWGTAHMVQNIVLHLVGQNIQERRRTWRTWRRRTWRMAHLARCALFLWTALRCLATLHVFQLVVGRYGVAIAPRSQKPRHRGNMQNRYTANSANAYIAPPT